jgi:endonuclease G, mitochondrial
LKNLILFLLILPQFVFAQRPEVLINTPIYSVVYSEIYQQPLEVKYKVQCVSGTASRKGMDFYTVDSIITSDNADYANNVWDKGHLAPAAAFNCTREMLHRTFSYLNCTLQHQDLNRGAWRLLEAHERDLAAVGRSVDVVIVLDFTNAQKLPTGATIPSGFWKSIYVGGRPVECYYFPNTKPANTDYTRFKIATCK